jgi:hypothetical protein
VSSPSNLVSAADLALLREEPSYFATLFQTDKDKLRARLGSAYANVDDQTIAFSMATMVAYQLASYRVAGDPQGYFPPPRSLALADLLAVPKLVCNEYCYLAAELYRIAFPAAGDSGTTITIVGFSSGPFGNHAQLLFTSGGVSVLSDPTLGFVAQTSFAYLRNGGRLSAASIHQLAYREEPTVYARNVMAVFRAEVYAALETGLYPRARLVYSRDLTNLNVASAASVAANALEVTGPGPTVSTVVAVTHTASPEVVAPAKAKAIGKHTHVAATHHVATAEGQGRPSRPRVDVRGNDSEISAVARGHHGWAPIPISPLASERAPSVPRAAAPANETEGGEDLLTILTAITRPAFGSPRWRV